jgi:hypothetical protein
MKRLPSLGYRPLRVVERLPSAGCRLRRVIRRLPLEQDGPTREPLLTLEARHD